MKTQSGTASDSYLSQMAASGGSTGGNAAVAPSPDDPSTSFEDLLKQQETGSASAPADWQSILADLAAKNAAAATDPATANPAPATTVPALPALPLEKNPLAKAASVTAGPATDSTASTMTTSKTSVASLYTGSSVFMAHAAALAAQARQGSAVTNDSATAAAQAETDAESGTASPTTTAKDFILAAALPKTIGKEPGLSEKKSETAPPEGSFLQADLEVGSAAWQLQGAAGTAMYSGSQSVDHQSVGANAKSEDNALKGIASGASGPAGMANGKKDAEMNNTLELPDLVSSGSNPMVTRTSADVNIQLGSNRDFKDALGQVMRVAELSGMNSTTPPLRVAIEIQTPPGAIVNVYVSKQDDGFRAQLSANDPQALSWVQDQISSLKASSDTGVPVRWLPAQLESSSSTSLSTSSSGSESGLSWDRGGQGQQGNPPSDERQQPSRQKRPLFEGLLAAGAHTSFLGVAALGRAA